MKKDLKGADAVAEIFTTDLKDRFNTDYIYLKVEATDLNTYKIIAELLNDHIEKIYKYDITTNYSFNLCTIERIIRGIIIRKFTK